MKQLNFLGEPFGDSTSKVFSGEPFGDVSTSDMTLQQAVQTLAKAFGYGDITAESIGDISSFIGNVGNINLSNIGAAMQTYAASNPGSNLAQRLASQSASIGAPRGASTQNVVQAVNTLRNVPGGFGQIMSFPPYMTKNCNVVQYSTRATIKGTNIASFIGRFESQLIGESIYQSVAGAGVGVATNVTFNSPSATQLAFAGPVLVQITAPDLQSIDDLQFSVTLDGNVTENGAVYNQFGLPRFAFKRGLGQKGDNSVYLYIFPYVNLATILLPVALRATNADPLVVGLSGIPTTHIVTVGLLAPDSKYWEDFKTAYGLQAISTPVTFR